MTILLTVGTRHSGALEVSSLLSEAGVAAPLPSADGNLSPEMLQAQILRSLEIDPNQRDSLAQVDVGSRWHQAAGSLLKASHHLPVWGWFDPASLLFMDFWLAADPRMRVLIVYADPPEELVRSAADAPSADAGAAAVLRDWERWNDALLRYHFRHPDRTLLVNSHAAMEDPGKLLELMARSIGTPGLKAPAPRAPVTNRSGALLLHAAQVAVSMNDDVRGLHQELHDAATLNGTPDPQTTPDAAALWDAARRFVEDSEQSTAKLREELGKSADSVMRALGDVALAQAEIGRLNAQCSQAVAERARIEIEYEQVQQTVQRLMSERAEQEQLANDRYLEIARLTEQLTDHQREVSERAEQLARLEQAQSDQRSALQPQLEALREDKELVELQLQQVQEELAHYFKAWQEERTRQVLPADSGQAVLQQFWRTQQPDVLALDLRRPIAGEQWYEPEADGRWSGPQAESSLHLPPLQPGRYLFEMDVMDAMDLSIVTEAQVEFQGYKHALSIEYFGGEGRLPAVCSARIEVTDADPDHALLLKLRLPTTISPSAHGSDDSRHLGLRLQQLRLIREPGA